MVLEVIYNMAVLHWKTPNGNEGSLLTEQLFYNNSINKILAGIKTFTNDIPYPAISFIAEDDTNMIGCRSYTHNEGDDWRCKQICFGKNHHNLKSSDPNTYSNFALTESNEDNPDTPSTAWVDFTANNGISAESLYFSYSDNYIFWREKHISPLYDSTKKWIKMHNRLIQWGTSNGTSGGGTTVTFPIAFSSAPIVIVLPCNTNGDAVQQITQVSSRTASNFVLHSMRSTYSGATAAYNGWGVSWLAIGNCAVGYPS